MKKESDMHILLPSSANLKERYMPDHEALARKVQALRELGQKIVLTSGTYDLLHIGHIRYLEEAKKHGDVLVVAVDSDEVTRRRKGPTRPIVPQDERLSMLASIWCVDLLTIIDTFHDKNGHIMAVRPDVLITSSTTKDFSQETKDMLKRKGFCNEFITLPAQAEVSTTARIRNLAIDGADELAKKITSVIEDHIKGHNGSAKPAEEKKEKSDGRTRAVRARGPSRVRGAHTKAPRSKSVRARGNASKRNAAPRKGRARR